MRITNKMITTKYMRSINDLSSELDHLNTKVASGRAFSKSSENTSAAVKAFKLRRDMSSTEGYQSNIDHAKSSLTNTESALSHMEELMQTAKDKILEANTGTASADERKVVATELRSIQDSLLQALNSNASGVYYFGGTNTDTQPFTLSSGGKLMYNGVQLDTIVPADQNRLTNDSMYVDIGLGANLIPDPSDPTKTIVDPSSVFQYSTPGIKIVGSGTTTAGGMTVSNNLYDLLGTVADQLDNPLYSYENIDALYGKLNTSSMEIIYNLTEVGAKESYLDFMTDRYDTQTLDMDERQVKVEGADPTKTIIQFKSQQVAYEAALQMGTKIIQPSIFNFMT